MEQPDYYYRRHRAIEDRQTRMGEWGFAAQHVRADDLVLRVPVGWRTLVKELDVALQILVPDYLFFDAYERHARLRFDFIAFTRANAAKKLVDGASLESTTTCVVCGAGAHRRARPGGRVTVLCDACSAADRAAAAERGDRYANLALLYFTSGDPHHPTPDELENWLDSID